MNSMRAAIVGLALAGSVCRPAVELGGPPMGGMNFWCAFFQTVKIVSLCTGQLEGAVIGAIGGGLACGMGW